jgi:predicted amidohydrolase YtcJ
VGRHALPTQEALSRAVPDHPVWLVRVDGHAGLANAAALRAAAGDARDARPRGRAHRARGRRCPAGVFVDNAQRLVARAVPPATREEQRAALRAAVAELHRHGLVGVHDAGESRETIELMEEMAARGSSTCAPT